MPADFLDMPGVVHTENGQLLSSPAFPPASLEHVANLVHAAEVVLPLVQTRNLLARIGLVDRLMDLSTRLDSDVLLELRSRMAAFHPVRLVRALEDTAATIAAGLNVDVEGARLLEAVQLDLLEYLRSSCAERHILDFHWDADAHGRRIRHVQVELATHKTVVWNLRERRIQFLRDAAPHGDGHDRLVVGAPTAPDPDREAHPPC